MGVSSSGCNGCCFTATLIFSLIFASAWTALAIIGFQLQDCSIRLDLNNKANILILVYFFNEECLPDWWKDVNSVAGLDFKTSKRTEAVLWWYAVSGALRAVAAVGAIVAMAVCSCGKPRRAATPRPSPLAWVWVAVSIAGLIGDLVCSVFYGLDIGHTQDLKDLTGGEWEIPSQIEQLFWGLKLCPIVMMLFCSRFIALWIMDACLLVMAIISLARQQNEAKIEGAHASGDDLAPWKSKFTKAAGIDKGQKENNNGRNNGNGEHVDRWPDNNQNMLNRSISEYYAEPFTISGSQQELGIQDQTDHRRVSPYMSSPVIDPGPYPVNTPSNIYAQPWTHGRPPPNDGGLNPRMDAQWQSQAAQRGDWDPRSPWMQPPTEQAFFPNHGYVNQSPPSQEQPTPSAGAHRSSSGAPADPEPARRYVEKLRDVEEERQAQEEARDAERRRRAEERAEEDRRYATSVQQEMIAKAKAMERSRKLRREAAGGEDADGEAKKENEGRKRGPAPAPPPRPRRPEELKNQTPWSYVGPALAHPKDLPMQTRAGRNDDDEDEDEEKPSVPVPDYTLHFKRPNDRPTIDTN